MLSSSFAAFGFSSSFTAFGFLLFYCDVWLVVDLSQHGVWFVIDLLQYGAFHHFIRSVKDIILWSLVY